MKKGRFVHEFVLVLLLAAAVVAIAAYSNLNHNPLTGNAILGEYTNQTSCEEANHVWETFTNESCTPIENCTTCETGCVSNYTQILCTAGCQADCTNMTNCTTCETNCVPAYTEVLCTEGCQQTCQTCQNVTTGGQCTGEVCDTTHLNLCSTQTTCETASGYWYNNVCNLAAAVCSESWTCGNWSDCTNGNQTRSCTDANSCGTTNSKPITVDTCVSALAATTQTVPTPVTCTPNWQCGDWQECVSENQARACTDTNNCGTQDGIPATSQACTVPIVANCSDKIKNQDETGIDCRGVCKKCSIFTIVGSAISGPIGSIGTSMQKIFSNKTNIFIASGALVVLVGGFFTFKFFRKHRLKNFKK